MLIIKYTVWVAATRTYARTSSWLPTFWIRLRSSRNRLMARSCLYTGYSPVAIIFKNVFDFLSRKGAVLDAIYEMVSRRIM